jgi:hypothetical protein
MGSVERGETNSTLSSLATIARALKDHYVEAGGGRGLGCASAAKHLIRNQGLDGQLLLLALGRDILTSMNYLRIAAFIALAMLAPAQTPDLRSVHKIYIEKMPNDLDQYLRAEFFKQLKGKVTIVLKKEEADGVITGINEEQKGTAAKITGRYLGLHDTVNGTISLLDKTETEILWSDEAGDRNLFFGIAHRGGERKVADRLVSKLKKAMGY